MRLPPVRRVQKAGTHRLIPSKYLPAGDSVLTLIADDEAHLDAIFELDDATNDRLRGERGLLPGIGPEELLAGVPHAAVVNATFCHAHPLGSRFNGPDRGAWYAGFELETAQSEVAFHKSVELAEIGWPDESVTYDEYLADFNAEFHDLRNARGFGACLAPDSYVASQALAESLLQAGSLGIVYPSVRRAAGTCVACFRPALVTNVRWRRTWRFTWAAAAGPRIERVRG
jgi:RES domain-containing protein